MGKKEKITIEEHLIFAKKMYVDYLNNIFPNVESQLSQAQPRFRDTVVRFAEYYEIDLDIANHLIDLGRAVYNSEE